ncbi:MAG: MATE family efflux transporter [Calditrichia bacterium]
MMLNTGWRKLKQRWYGETGYGEVLKVAFPLILSTGSWSLQHFIDRMFLTWYSPEAIAASMPAGMVNWTLTSLFVGTASYVNTFVAQYYGAHRYDRIGPSVWQGIYLSVFVIVFALIAWPFVDIFFQWIAHDPAVQKLEIDYFRILLVGAPFVVVSNAVTSFFTGRGKTLTIMWVNILATGLNIVFDYLFIFGKMGLPEMGIQGAGWATVLSVVVTAATLFFLMVRANYNRLFHTLRGWRFDFPLFRRLIRYGLPNGLQFMLEMIAFTIFILLIGKIGVVELAASNIAFNINSLAFLPMYGMSIAISSLVGQRLGENQPDKAEKTTWTSFHMTFLYFGFLALAYFFLPKIFIFPFSWQAEAEIFGSIESITVILLRFVAFYSLFDALNMVFSAAIKGAGDTRFVAVVTIGLSWIVMLLPSYIVLKVFHGGIFWLWCFVTLYVVSLGIVFLIRFLKGPWREMRVIESQ